MSSNVCGNCANFKPAKGAKFFDCTFAQQGGVKYAMQVRPDTRSCEAFVSLKPSPKPQEAVKPPAATKKRADPQRGVLCNWGRIIMLAAIIIIILLIAFGAYTCFKGSPAVTPTPTNTPTPPPPPTGIQPTPSPTPTPVPISSYPMGTWVQTTRLQIKAVSIEKTKHFENPGPWSAPPGTYFIFVTITVTNISSSAISVQSSNFYLVDSMGITYQHQLLHMGFYGAFPQTKFALGAWQTVYGKIRFVVPEISTGLEVRTNQDGYIISWTTDL